MMNKIKAISVFSSAGIGELLLKNTNVEVVAANELLPKRAECYSHFTPTQICTAVILHWKKRKIIWFRQRRKAVQKC